MSAGKHTIYNLAGSIAPMFITVATVPMYLHLVGNTRYGVLALVWMFLGYFGVFDPGIGRAAAYHIARLHDSPAKDREEMFWTALTINLCFGLLAGILLYAVAQPLFVSTFKMPANLRGEVIASLPWLAVSMPISIIGNVLTGILQAREWFGFSNILNVLNAVLAQIVPLAVAYFHGPDLTWLIPAILLTRALGTIPVCLALIKAMPLGQGGRFKASLVKPLFAYGGWVTITNVLNPVLTSMDRLLIGSLLNADAVAYYTVSTNLVTKVSVVPGALISSLFPKLSRGNHEDSGKLASDAVIELAAVMTPLIVIGVIALPIFMRLWVGAAFAAQSVAVATILLLGMWINGLAYIPYGHLQARNRPDIVAKFHAVEVLPFLALLWVGLHFYGLVGAAWATTLRVTIDAVLLFAVGGQLRGWYRIIPGAAFVVVAPFCAPTSFSSPLLAPALALVVVTLAWSWWRAPFIRSAILKVISNVQPAKATT